MKIVPLVASVRFDSIAGLPEFSRKPRIEGEEVDRAFGVPPDVTSGALLVYANGVANAFRVEQLQIAFQVERDGAPPIYLGVAAVDREPLGEAESSGVTVLAGFDPRRAKTGEEGEYLCLRGF